MIGICIGLDIYFVQREAMPETATYYSKHRRNRTFRLVLTGNGGSPNRQSNSYDS